MQVFVLMSYCAGICVDELLRCRLCWCYCAGVFVAVINGVNYYCEMGGACSTYGGEKRRVEDFVGKPEGKDHLEDPGIDGKVILRWLIRKWDRGAWTGFIWLRIETGEGLL